MVSMLKGRWERKRARNTAKNIPSQAGVWIGLHRSKKQNPKKRANWYCCNWEFSFLSIEKRWKDLLDMHISSLFLSFTVTTTAHTDPSISMQSCLAHFCPTLLSLFLYPHSSPVDCSAVHPDNSALFFFFFFFFVCLLEMFPSEFAEKKVRWNKDTRQETWRGEEVQESRDSNPSDKTKNRTLTKYHIFFT
jgi:hypothetical protein